MSAPLPATPPLPAPARDAVVVLARLVLGVVFTAHGWQKLGDMGVAGTTTAFTKMGVPAPGLTGPLTGGVELVGGLALLAGAAVPVVGLLLAATMAGAVLLVHGSNGVFVTEGGFELAAGLGVGCLLLAVTGAGRVSVDALVVAVRRRSRATASAETREAVSA
jgi:putative oxidoreductase